MLKRRWITLVPPRCLVQISTADADYVVDALALRFELRALAPAFSDPKIRKVFHACQGVDIPRLQRDFGIFVVNVFDTQEAARVLGAPLGLIALYASAGVISTARRDELESLKRAYQNCDWRSRPLSPAQLEYAVCDARHLVDLEAYLNRELRNFDPLRDYGLPPASAPRDAPRPPPPPGPREAAGDEEADMVTSAYCRSQRATLCLWRAPRSPRLQAARDKQFAALARDAAPRFSALVAWRDAEARRLDEGPHAVCPSAALAAFAKRWPTTLRGLLLAFDPLPPLVATDAFGVQASLLACLAALAENQINPYL